MAKKEVDEMVTVNIYSLTQLELDWVVATHVEPLLREAHGKNPFVRVTFQHFQNGGSQVFVSYNKRISVWYQARAFKAIEALECLSHKLKIEVRYCDCETIATVPVGGELRVYRSNTFTNAVLRAILAAVLGEDSVKVPAKL